MKSLSIQRIEEEPEESRLTRFVTQFRDASPQEVERMLAELWEAG